MTPLAARPSGRRSPTTGTSSPGTCPWRSRDGGFTAIVGPNACGKSTLLRALARMLKPRAGTVLLDGAAIAVAADASDVARRLGLLPQSSIAPDGITVADLVARGRYPHQRLLRPVVARGRAGRARGDGRRRDVSRPRRPAGRRALRRPAPARLARDGARAGDAAAAARRADDVPRHRAPDRGARPVRRAARGAAARSSRCCTTSTMPAATRRTCIAMRDGAIVAAGRAGGRSSTPRWSSRVFGLHCRVVPDPETGTPMVVPAARRARRAAAQSSSRIQSPARSQ